MTIHIFLGPTLSLTKAKELLPDALFLPPVSQGDVLRSAARRPAAIGIVDGRFQDVPAVWHKEILWAMSRGVAVYGSASMGALRAAELADFGMRGVGTIFEAYRSGAINDDDEVAVAHADAADGYRAANEAMVNIRPTLALATRDGVVGDATATALVGLAKQAYYPTRGYPQLLAAGAEAGLPADELAALREWLPANRINQKALDAQEMLRLMAAQASATAAAVPFRFEHTSFFEQSRQSAGELSGAAAQADPDTRAGGPASVTALEILEELRLDPAGYRHVWERAALRTVVDGGHAATPVNLAQAAERFRRARDLMGTDEIRAWLAANDTSVEHFAALVGTEQRVHGVIDEIAERLPAAVVDQLRVDGTYAPLVAAIVAKREFLAEHGLDQPIAATDDETTAHQLRWYFDSIGKPLPASLELHWREVGFTDQRGFLRAVRREYHFRTLAPPGE
ncbi:hypothetical protein F4553_002195 [Allocatelliglobosispora scoriae]|uniref:TfuA-like core domain-containing protein n=1 Tax=Allocatelliglobosispora scoriae TaxID=643052 RepID=A0A841BNF1_9ACTN|nr:TfuA-like protein [Allocatelliglobosispora scoriae]MBB5868816.1 hypothetical protein [Allocatelliglobosispora scoriae]